jgi:hypothetical protein
MSIEGPAPINAALVLAAGNVVSDSAVAQASPQQPARIRQAI